jgi:hypothetical protein
MMRITEDALSELEDLEKAAEKVKENDRQTIRSQDLK